MHATSASADIVNGALGVPIAQPQDFSEVLHRTVDITISIAVLLIILPVLLLIGLIVKLTSAGPVFFAHERIGRAGSTFRCLKFRSMVVNSAEVLERHLAQNPEARHEWLATQKLRRDPRVTTIGRILRKTSLDEIPQLFNVLRGDMSIVGPRPVTRDELRRFGRHALYYCSVRPGITGLRQISGRSNTTYRRRIALDTAYVRNRSVLFDLKIIMRTVPVVISGEGSC